MIPVGLPRSARAFVTPELAEQSGKIWETGWEAVRIGIAVYLVSFAFVYNPALLTVGPWHLIVLAFVTGAIGCVLIAAAIRSFGVKGLPMWARGLAMLAGLALIGPENLLVNIGALALGAFSFYYATKYGKRETAPSAAAR